MQALIARDVDCVLCFGAHSDDIEIGCGGTLLQMLDANPQLSVHWYVFSADNQREQEARASAERFLSAASNKSIEVLDFKDSYFPDQWGRLKEMISGIAKNVHPDIIFTHRLEDRHQDHRAIAELTWCAFRNHLILEYEIQKFEGDLGQPNFYCSIAEQFREQKIANILDCFLSQSEKPWFDAALFRSLMRIRGSECNAESGHAEAFHCRKTTFQLASGVS